MFEEGKCKIVDAEGGIVCSAPVSCGIVRLKCSSARAFAVANGSTNTELWHRCMGHIAPSAILQMKTREMVAGLGTAHIEKEMSFCEACLEGKQHAANVPRAADHSGVRDVLDLVHSEVVGPMSIATYSG
eukprot:ANDGO_06757.mRNA.1 Copia protein